MPAGVRPTPARVRETIFNILATQLRGAQVLDLYAGSGSLGIEALSRGAHSVVFVERQERAMRILQTNLSELGAQPQTRVERAEARTWQVRARRLGRKFDLAFVDPPYRSLGQPDAWPKLLAALKPLLNINSVAYCEAVQYPPATATSTWRIIRRGHCGEVRWIMLRPIPPGTS